MTLKIGIRRGFGAFCAILISGCATTALTSAWRNPAYRGQPRKIMVIRIAKKPLNEKQFEDEFVRQLKALGTDAVACHSVMPDDKRGDRAFLAATMKEQGADAMLVSRLVSMKTASSRVSGTTVVFPFNYGSWGDYSGFDYEDMDAAGFMVKDEYALMEADLYDAGGGELIWSASSETEIQGSHRSQIKSYIGAMVKDLIHQKVLR